MDHPDTHRIVHLCALMCLLSWGCEATRSATEQSAIDGFLAWRQRREEALRSDNGYLALAGLYWLEDGYHTFGSAADNDIVLPAGRAPARAGAFRVKAGVVTVVCDPGAELTVHGEKVTELRMVSDFGGQEPTKIRLGDLTLWLIARSGRLGIRLSDPESPVLKNYASTHCFPYAPRWRVQARFEPYPTPRTLYVPTIIGTRSVVQSPGRLAFSIDGETHTLQPTGQSESDYFIVFGDHTNGEQTYGGGRFLKVAIPAEGDATVIDFNRAYNPPCAYSPYTTCPLPPPQNKLPVRVEAGERIEGKR